ncbi:MAG: hypothetical protein JWN04_111 [Myxococcaceae bacterium]|nr:hypothetical protein [Myxococcaceae bacterium]
MRIAYAPRETNMAPILPNSPLAEVVLEMRFHGDLAYQAAWPSIQQDLRSAYPHVLVAGSIPGVAPQLQPIQLSSEDQKQRVMMALNMFAVTTTRYSGFDAFVESVERAEAVFSQRASVASLTRLGLRYMNQIPNGFGESASAVLSGRKLHPCLNLAVGGWNALARLDTEPSQLVYYSGDPSTLALRISLTSDPQGMGVTTLDLDCFRQGLVRRDELRSFLVAAHVFIELTFFELVTPEYLTYLRGGR